MITGALSVPSALGIALGCSSAWTVMVNPNVASAEQKVFGQKLRGPSLDFGSLLRRDLPGSPVFPGGTGRGAAPTRWPGPSRAWSVAFPDHAAQPSYLHPVSTPFPDSSDGFPVPLAPLAFFRRFHVTFVPA